MSAARARATRSTSESSSGNCGVNGLGARECAASSVVAARQVESGPSVDCAPFEAILLAAGESRRMGYPKPLLKLGARTFIEILAAAILQSVARLIVVVGAHADAVRGAIPADPRILVVENPDYLKRPAFLDQGRAASCWPRRGRRADSSGGPSDGPCGDLRRRYRQLSAGWASR